jgi:uncharacterized protein (TIGR03083 family)
VSTRPLRQYYDPVLATLPDDVGPGLEAWRRHRDRLIDELGALSDDQWKATTRCTDWDAKDVIGHLVSVDAFWVFTLSGARAKQEPGTFLRHFDPSTGTNELVAATRALSNGEMLDRFTTGTRGFVELVESFAPQDWASVGESPLGHLPARLLFEHAFWDSWLHERDIFEPLGLAPPIEPDEIRAVACFALLFAGLQGGLLDDPAPVGDGLSEPVDVTLAFDELPEAAVRVEFATGVHITLADATTASASGSAVDVVECVTGRRPMRLLDGVLPADLVAHLARAAQVL